MDVVLINLLAAELKTVPQENDAEYKALSIQCLKVSMSIQQPHVGLSVRIPYMVEAFTGEFIAYADTILLRSVDE